MSSAAPPRPPPTKTTSTTRPPPAPKPPLTLHPTAHIGESISLTGKFPITIAPYAILHPRVTLNSLYGPIHIGEGTVIGAKTSIGLTKPVEKTGRVGRSEDGSDSEDDGESDEGGVRLEKDVTIGPMSHISASYIGEASVIEPQVRLPAGLRVGRHAKICSGVEIPEGAEDVGDWVVVGGFGGRRGRRVGGNGNGNGEEGEGERSGAEIMEEARLKALERERIMLRGLLKRNVKV
jgi:UDP-3-O-[3-hydroxymyristoyl] glucosamine N-acyltransferase